MDGPRESAVADRLDARRSGAAPAGAAPLCIAPANAGALSG